MEKQELRKEFLKKRKKFSIDNVVHLSKKINSNLKILKEYVNANSILFYVSFGNEVDTHELIKKAIDAPIVAPITTHKVPKKVPNNAPAKIVKGVPGNINTVTKI